MKTSLLLLLCSAFITSASASVDADLLAGLKARTIGPAATSGRITDIEAIHNKPNIIYAATATGGLWQSINAGLNWTPIFDEGDFASIGAIAINQHNPSIIWVGTGEGNTRNSTSYGGGMYKSIDAGKTWKAIGLEGTERINRIALHPDNPNIAYAAALGTLWSENEDRGLYKTVDGGKSWQKILYINEKTGATDIKMDPENPNKLYAATWQFRRWPYRFESGGPGSGLYISYDGGENWQQKTQEDGLPEGDLGRMVIAVSQNNSNRVYALAEAEKSALLRSDDGGHSWQTVNSEVGVADRPFYYSELEVDPKNHNIVYNIATFVRRSIDGGKTFSQIPGVNCCAAGNTIHIDSHTLWINPDDPRHLILGNDGGIAISQDKADTWRYVQNLPLSQFYHIRVDNDHPYNIYGGMQDNGTWRGPAEVFHTGGIRSVHWQEIGFGDGFDAMPHPDNNRAGYGMSQGGYLTSWDLDTGESKVLFPNPPLNDQGEPVELRFNWNAGLAQDPFNADTIYYGSQFVHRSNDRGLSWEVLSADLTSNNAQWQTFKASGGITPDVTAAENYTSITTIAPSPLKVGVIWVGTDDGRVHVTQDGGQSWQSIERHVRKVPENSWVPHIEPSLFDPGSAFIVFDNHRRGDMNTYVQRIDNYGKTFTDLSANNLRGYGLSVKQDHVDKNLLFLGTELGLYMSTNGGEHWFKFTQGVPTVSVMDMDIQRRENDLVLGTHGRSAFVIDDYRALRGLNNKALNVDLDLVAITDGQLYNASRAPSSRFWGDGAFVGENETYGAVFHIIASGDFLSHPDKDKEKQRLIAKRIAESAKKSKQDDKVDADQDEQDKESSDEPVSKATFVVKDGNDKVIRTFKKPLLQGLNKVAWTMTRDGTKYRPGDEPKEDADLLPDGYTVLPGRYHVEITLNGNKVSGEFEVLQDPRLSIARAALQARQAQLTAVDALYNGVAELLHATADAKHNITWLKAQLESASKPLSAEEKDDEAHPYNVMTAQAEALLKGIGAQEDLIRTAEDKPGIVDESFTLDTKLSNAADYIFSHNGKPSATALRYMDIAKAELKKRANAINELIAKQAQLNADYLALGLNPFKDIKTVSPESS